MQTQTPLLPVVFLSHGGGPWPYVEALKHGYAVTAQHLRDLPSRMASRPKAILMVTAHWEAPQFSVSSSPNPPMLYDYQGFPEHTYDIQYPAPGSPALAARVGDLFGAAGIPYRVDAERGFDHGTFVVGYSMFPDAAVPIVMVSLKTSYDPGEHIRLGIALQPLREEGVLIVGSGLSFHNMRGFGHDAATPIADAFEAYLNQAITQSDPRRRNEALARWEEAPGARSAHPQEDHLLPLMVIAGAAGADVGRRLFVDRVMKVAMANYVFGQLNELHRGTEIDSKSPAMSSV